MTLSHDRIGGLLFLALSLAYGYFAADIPLLPGDEFEPMTARSLPYALAALGAGLSLLLIIIGGKQSASGELSGSRLEIKPTLQLMALMLAYGLTLDWLGFAIATVLFLILGFMVLDERRLKTLLLVPSTFVLALWFLLTQLLDIYLESGRIFTLGG